MKNKNGVTLITLVITIIIILILTGIAIRFAVGEDEGIIVKTTEAVKAQAVAQAKEELGSAWESASMDYQKNKKPFSDNSISDYLTKMSHINTYLDGDGELLENPTYDSVNKTYSVLYKPNNQDVEITFTISEQGEIINYETSEVAIETWDGSSVSEGLLGSGTVEDPFLIRNAEDLNFLAYAVTNDLSINNIKYTFACYRQVRDIYLNDTSNFSQWNNSSVQANLNSFSPIGCNDSQTYNNKIFFGKYDGNNHKIDGLYINKPAKSGVGLFSALGYYETKQIVDAEICNLKLTNAYIRGKEFVGGIVGSIYGKSKYINCQVDGVITLVGKANPDDRGSWGTGGICGELISDCIIENCTNYAKIIGEYGAGGIAGRTSGGEIKNCNNYGSINGISKVGGITGELGGQISGCNNSGDINYVGNGDSCAYFGGIVGNDYGTVSECNNSGKISVYAPNLDDMCVLEIGGIAGLTQYAQLIKCHNTGNIEINVKSIKSGLGIGGVVGYVAGDTTIKNCSNTGTITTTPTIQTTGNIVGYGDAVIE